MNLTKKAGTFASHGKFIYRWKWRFTGVVNESDWILQVTKRKYNNIKKKEEALSLIFPFIGLHECDFVNNNKQQKVQGKK